MATQHEETPEPGDMDDVPSDFFDDFTKEEFIDGLSVIDSWDNGEKKRSSRIDAITIDSVKDLRELIADDRRKENRRDYYDSVKKKLSKDTSRRKDAVADYIKPGSRRDPNKTNEAIRKDKEVKVKEYLEKCLEDIDELRPPGTELDDYFAEKKPTEKKHVAVKEKEHIEWSQVDPESKRRSPRWSPKRVLRHSPHHSPRRYSPQRKHRRYSPTSSRRSPQRRWSPNRRYPHRPSPHRRSPHRRSPQWGSPKRRSLQRGSPKRRSPQRGSPKRRSPQQRSSLRGNLSPRRRHSPKWTVSSKSPFKDCYGDRRSLSRTPPLKQDSFLYPGEMVSSNYPPADIQYAAGSSYSSGLPPEYPGSAAPVFQQPTYYPSVYDGVGYDFGGQQASAPVPQPVPAPVLNPVPAPPLDQCLAPPTPVPAPAMVPAPAGMSPPVQATNVITPYDALAQLVAEGKLSKEDYLKLAPNKGALHAADNKARITVLHRCNQILNRLTKMTLPNRLVMSNKLVDIQDTKTLAPKYCSPLKRQATVDFHFTNVNETSSAAQNKVLIDNVLATIGLDNIVSKPKKKVAKGMKDAAVQTTRAYCDLCEIRESTTYNEIGTSIDLDHFSVTTHTQVVDEELISSKAVFNTSGSGIDSAPMSIAHLTPAQLVSQLAARAKTLKQTSEPMQPQFRRHPPYDYDGRGGQQYQNNYNYRY